MAHPTAATLLSSILLHEWYSYPLSCGLRVYSVAAVVSIVSGILVTLIRPYKSALYNALDILHLLCMAVALVGTVAFFIAYVEDLKFVLP